jgi:hypothetical protein
MPRDRLRIVVGGYLVRAPLGGQAWHYLQYVSGLAALGHEVLYIEDSCFFDDDEHEWYYDPDAGKSGTDPAYGLEFATNALSAVGHGERWAFYEAHAGRWHGPAADTAVGFCRDADLFVNVSAVNPIRPWLAGIPRRIFVDTDPGFTQIRLLTNPINRRHALQHNVFATFGENIPAGYSSLPSDAFTWFPTRQPMVLEAWHVTPGRPDAPLTAVLAWQTYPPIEHDGLRYGVKADSFRPLLDLPARSRESFELAVSGDQAPRDLLRKNGWRLLDRGPRTPSDYQHYLQSSKAELGIAKHGYVASRSGWFSERSAAYLASGRPIVMQNTGFTRWLNADKGVLPFDTPAMALSALDDLQSRYEAHCRGAREVAAEYFESSAVLSRLIDNASRLESHSNRPVGV